MVQKSLIPHVWLMSLFVPTSLVDNTSSGVTCKLESNVNVFVMYLVLSSSQDPPVLPVSQFSDKFVHFITQW